MTATTRESFIAHLRLQLCLLAIPVFVWPKTAVQVFYGRVRGHCIPTSSHALANAVIKWLSTSLTLPQFRTLTSPPLDHPQINNTLRSTPPFSTLSASTNLLHTPSFTAHWLPQIPNPTITILYIHGGGFVSGSSGGSASSLLQTFQLLATRGVRAQILSVDYDLAPEARYPVALGQVRAAYEFVLGLGHPVVLMGDSAGGNLGLALLRDVAMGETTRWPVCASFISPWVRLDTGSKSMMRNERFDCLSRGVLDGWAEAYCGKAEASPVQALTDPALWVEGWKEMLPVATLIMAGELEMFLDDIRDMARSIEKDGYDGLDLFVEPGMCHAWPVVEYSSPAPKTFLDESDENPEVVRALRGLKIQADWIAEHCTSSG